MAFSFTSNGCGVVVDSRLCSAWPIDRLCVSGVITFQGRKIASFLSVSLSSWVFGFRPLFLG